VVRYLLRFGLRTTAEMRNLWICMVFLAADVPLANPCARGDGMNAPNAGMTPKRILYIDDDAELALLFKRWLEHGGHTVSTDCNPRHALEALRGHANDFDLVVTDYRMPDIDGIAVAQTINLRYPNLRCAVVTGDVSTDTLASAMAAVVGPVLRKPFAPREYEDLIRRCTS